MNQPSAQANITVPVVVGGLIGAALGIVPPCCCCCLNTVLAGAIAGAMFARAAGFVPIERGAMIGSLAGALAGAGGAVMDSLRQAAFRPWFEGWVDQVARYGDSEAREMLEQLGAWEGGGGPGWFLAGLATNIAIGAVLGALGGMLGVALMRREPPPPAQSYPPPPPYPLQHPPYPPPPAAPVDAPPVPAPPVPLPPADPSGSAGPPPSAPPARESRIAGGGSPPPWPPSAGTPGDADPPGGGRAD